MTQIDKPSDIDAHTGMGTTGHEWDGIRELNTPLPRWWLNILYATIVWAFFYCIAYPAIPLIQSFTPGVLGWSSRQGVNDDLNDLRKLRAPIMAALSAASLEEIAGNPQLRNFAIAQGKAAFGDNCAPCHGAGGGGGKGYANLNDDDWLWGGTLEQISATLTHGIRSEDDLAHAGVMPAFGKDGGGLCAFAVELACAARGGPCGGGRHFRGKLRRLPWRKWQGQYGAGRAQSHRRHLALWFGQGHDRRRPDQWTRRRDAGLGGPP